MVILDLIEISKNYEAQKILCEVDFHLEEGERVAIIGQNGGGKSTLLNIINGTLEMDDGRRVINNSVKIDMLQQTPVFDENLVVKDAIENELQELKDKKRRFEEVSNLLSNDFKNRELLKEQEELSLYLDAHNAWNIDDKIERILQEFDLKKYEDRPMGMLSGGEQRRVALASLLLKKPDILLLDEPTNHLDVYMVEFLEELLLKERFTLVLISHDRYFINSLATKIIEIDECKLRSFKGGYSDYLKAKEELLKSIQKSHQNLLKLLKSEEEWLSRGVKARLKRNEGRKKRVLELREQAKKNPSAIRKMQLQLQREQKNFNQTENVNRKKMLFEVENISITLGGKLLLKDFSVRILQQDKIAIVGKNGTGKSTLLKLLLDKIKPSKGAIKRGDFKIGYFDQDRSSLDDDKTLIETFCPNGGDRVDVRGKNMHVFGYLKNFLFPKEHLDKKIGVLSGGEKSRVALALLFTKEYDCLILDEPTNDLDIPTINILEEYLMSFQGALIFVSHDRYFVDKIAKKLFILKGNGVVEESHSMYSEYLDIEKEITQLEEFDKKLKNEEKEIKKRSKKQTKLSYKENKILQEYPKKIEVLENEIKDLNECLSNPECYKDKKLDDLYQTLKDKEDDLEKLLEVYFKVEEKKETLERGV